MSIGYYYDSIRIGKPEPGGLPSDLSGGTAPPYKRKEGDASESYISDLIQLLIFIVALVGLCYEIFKGKNRPPLLPIVTAAR